MLYERAQRIAKDAKSLHRVCLATNAQDLADFYIPEELSDDTTSLTEVLKYLVTTKQVQEDYLVILQPTVPFRMASFIDECVAQCLEYKAPSLVAINHTKPTGSLYMVSRDLAGSGRIYGHPTIRVYQDPQINIDTEYDLLLAEEEYACRKTVGLE